MQAKADISPAGAFQFDGFHLDLANRRLSRDGAPLEVSGRYFDALVLLVSEAGRLVSKDRFMSEVWHGVPVTDEALTQCIRNLRRQLGDDASRPRLIETVPKHGYRFIAAVSQGDLSGAAAPAAVAAQAVHSQASRWQRFLWLSAAGTLGGGLAGIIGGLLYGFIGSSQPAGPAMGAASVLLVMASITTLVAVLGGAGVAAGIAASATGGQRLTPSCVLGGAVGGLLVGAVVKLIGSDAFGLLFGQLPGDITGAAEGALIGGALGLAVWWAARSAASARRATALGALTGGAAGLLVSVAGGRLMAGSLDQLTRSFKGSHLELSGMAALVGEDGFGPVSLAVTACLEGALFGACVVGAMVFAHGKLAER